MPPQTFDPTKPSTAQQTTPPPPGPAAPQTPQTPTPQGTGPAPEFDPAAPSDHRFSAPVRLSLDPGDFSGLPVRPWQGMEARPGGRMSLPDPAQLKTRGPAPPRLPINLVPPDRSAEFARTDIGDIGEITGMIAAPEIFGPKAGLSLLLRMGARMGLAAGGAVAGRAVGETLSPEAPREGTTTGRMLGAAGTGAGMELAGGVVTGARMLRGAQSAAETAAAATGGGPPSILSTARQTFVAPIERAAIDAFAGPPKIYPPELAKDIPEVNVATFMGDQATAGQVRGNKLMTGVESWLRSTFGGRPVDQQVQASARRLQTEVEDILAPFGTPPTERAAGQNLLTPEHAEIRATHAADRATAEQYHQSILAQRQAEESAAKYQQEALDAAAQGSAGKAQQLQAESDRLLQEAQQHAEGATALRRQVYGSLGPVRTQEEAGTVTRQIHERVEAARDKAVDQAYSHVDDVAQGVKVNLEPLVTKAMAAQETTPEILAAMNPAPPRMAQAITETGTEAVDPGAAKAAQDIQALFSPRLTSSGAVTPSEVENTKRQLAEALARAGVTPEEVQHREITFTQARRLRSELGRISFRAKDSNPSLSYWANQYRKVLDTAMTGAANSAGSEAKTALDAADKLFTQTKQVYEEGILAELASRDAHQAAQYLLGRDASEMRTVFNELGPDVQKALRSAVVDSTLKDPATGTWRTGKQLQQALGRIRPEIREVLFQDLNTPLASLAGKTRAGEEAVGLAKGAVRGAEQARGQALREGVSAVKHEGRVASAQQKTQQALLDYQEALRTADRTAGKREAALDPVGAFRTLITPGTDPTALALKREQVTQMLGPEAWPQVQARWLHDMLGDDLPKLMDRLSKFRPETVRALIPDTGLRNRVYQLARIADHLGHAEPKASKWVFMTHLSSMVGTAGAAVGASLAGKPILATGLTSALGSELFSPYILSRILADPHAGPALVTGIKAGELGQTATAIKLANQVAAWLRREGLAAPQGPPPKIPVRAQGAGPGAAAPGGPPPIVKSP